MLTNEKIRQDILDAVKRVAEKGGAWRGIRSGVLSDKTVQRYRWHAKDLGHAVLVRPARHHPRGYDIQLASE